VHQESKEYYLTRCGELVLLPLLLLLLVHAANAAADKHVATTLRPAIPAFRVII